MVQFAYAIFLHMNLPTLFQNSAMEAWRSVFKNVKGAVIGMIHVQALPGLTTDTCLEYRLKLIIKLMWCWVSVCLCACVDCVPSVSIANFY